MDTVKTVEKKGRMIKSAFLRSVVRAVFPPDELRVNTYSGRNAQTANRAKIAILNGSCMKMKISVTPKEWQLAYCRCRELQLLKRKPKPKPATKKAEEKENADL